MLLLRKESFFRFNRAMLICIILLSLTLPLCNFHFMTMGTNPVAEHLNTVVEVGMPIMVIDTDMATSEIAVNEPSYSIDWFALVSWIYIIGMTVTIVVKLVQMMLLYRTINKGVLWKEKKDGVTIFCHVGDVAPFSCFRTIVISEKDYAESAREILCHELGHIHCMHSLDIILVNICEVVQWCNPLSWILAGSLRDVHEYEADDAVLASGVEAHKYQLLLIKKAVGSSSYAFANSFNHSLLKKRITMMIREKSNPWMRTKSLYIIPVALVALSAFATPELNNKIDEVAQDAIGSSPLVANADKVSEMPSNEKTFKEESAVTVAEEPTVEQIDIENAVGLKDYYILIDGKESTINDLKSLKKNDATIAFVCNLGPVSDELRKLGLTRVVTYKNEEGMKSMYVKKGNQKAENGIVAVTTHDTDEVFEVCEEMPVYPGGIEALMQFIAQNVRYPQEAASKGIQGRVMVAFKVNKDGSIYDIEPVSIDDKKYAEVLPEVTVKSYGAEGNKDNTEALKALFDEAVRVVGNMPSWTPGFQRNIPVRVKFMLPITFRLS